MFVIQCRYEYWSLYKGKIWTKWFNVHGARFENIEQAKESLKTNKKKSESIDKSTKLKHEFQIIEL